MDKIYRLALFVLFVLILVQFINVFIRTEHMNPMLLNHQYQDWPESGRSRDSIAPPDYDYPTTFYRADKVPEQPLTNPIQTDIGLGCGPKYDWMATIAHSKGADGKYGDMLWAKTSPKMVLRDNCLSCDKAGSESTFREPVGVDEYDNKGLPLGDGYKLL